MSVKISGAEELKRKLNNLKKLNGDQIALAIAERGAEIAKSNINSQNENILVAAVSSGDNKAKITAMGKGVAYIEYGIGSLGEGSYKGDTPKQPLTFKARNGKIITITKWIYNYFVRVVNPNAKQVKGFQAIAPMWRTANSLEKGEAKKAVIDLINKEVK